MTEAQAKQLGYYVERGAYTGTGDDRADRWYIGSYASPAVDRRGQGYRTKREALEAIAEQEQDSNA